MGTIIVTTRTYTTRVNGFIDTSESVGAQCFMTISFTYNYVIIIIYFNVGTSTVNKPFFFIGNDSAAIISLIIITVIIITLCNHIIILST